MSAIDWTYCKDRLPDPDHMDEDGYYLKSKPCFVGVVDKDGNKNIGVGTYLRLSDEEYWEGITADYDDLDDVEVIAWAQFTTLPDPPLGDS